jgi:hypothetical protein
MSLYSYTTSTTIDDLHQHFQINTKLEFLFAYNISCVPALTNPASPLFVARQRTSWSDAQHVPHPLCLGSSIFARFSFCEIHSIGLHGNFRRSRCPQNAKQLEPEGHRKNAKKGDSAEKEPSPDVATPEENDDKAEVPWSLPSVGKANDSPDVGPRNTAYAPILYNQPWDALRTGQESHKWPFLRTPLYKQRTGKNKTVGGAFGMSAALCALFNNIKSDSSGEGGTRFTRDVFHNAFANADDNGAVVASSTATNPVEVLDQDFRVQV